MKKSMYSNNSFKKASFKKNMYEGLTKHQLENCMLLGESDTLYSYMATNARVKDKAARNKSNNLSQKR